MGRKTNRRRFLGESAALATGFWLGGASESRADKSPNEALNVAFIGVGGRGDANVKALHALKQNVVAFADVDDNRAAKAYTAFPNTPRFRDYRKLLDTTKGIDAVVVATPDHTHAPASMAALRLGKHVYCEKPLAHSVYEVRLMHEAADKGKLATQMGNAGTGANGFRQGVEVIQSGVIGLVHTVHVWTNRPGNSWKQGVDVPTDQPPPPAGLDWNLWLGTAAERPYHREYLPHTWRGWYDFGCGALGDMACHTANLAFMGLKLGSPTTISAVTSEPKKESFPSWSIITFEFPARGELPPVKLVWYDGGKLPPEELLNSVGANPRAKEADESKPKRKPITSGSLLIGSKGMLYSPDDYGLSHQLFPKASFADYQAPAPTLPRVSGPQLVANWQEWVTACKTGSKTLSNFEYAARFTEAMLLGAVAVRTGKKINWDSANMKAIGCPEADLFVRPAFRKGWDL
jgi:predicted dehydrogenase